MNTYIVIAIFAIILYNSKMRGYKYLLGFNSSILMMLMSSDYRIVIHINCCI